MLSRSGGSPAPSGVDATGCRSVTGPVVLGASAPAPEESHGIFPISLMVLGGGTVPSPTSWDGAAVRLLRR
jgi:hypothetical protein